MRSWVRLSPPSLLDLWQERRKHAARRSASKASTPACLHHGQASPWQQAGAHIMSPTLRHSLPRHACRPCGPSSQVQAAQLEQAAKEAGPEPAVGGQAEGAQRRCGRQRSGRHSFQRCGLAVGWHPSRDSQAAGTASVALTPSCQGEEAAQFGAAAAVAVGSKLHMPPERAALANRTPRLCRWLVDKLVTYPACNGSCLTGLQFRCMQRGRALQHFWSISRRCRQCSPCTPMWLPPYHAGAGAAVFAAGSQRAGLPSPLCPDIAWPARRAGRAGGGGGGAAAVGQRSTACDERALNAAFQAPLSDSCKHGSKPGTAPGCAAHLQSASWEPVAV